MRNRAVRRPSLLIPLLSVILAAPALAQPAFQVADINSSHPPLLLWDQTDEMETAGGLVFFVADDGVHGHELWASDGTFSASYLVRDVCPGACSSTPRSLTAFGGALYFVADDGVHGREMWRSDGTGAGTALVLEMVAGLGDGVDSLANADGQSIFGVLAATSPLGKEPFHSDGTAAGTELMEDINPGQPGSNPRFLALAGTRTVFAADNGAHGTEPWAWDPATSDAYLLLDINPVVSSSMNAGRPGVVHGPDAITAPGGAGVYFTATDGGDDYEIWVTDGTNGGTHLVKDVRPGSLGSYPLGYTLVNGVVCFKADGGNGEELWRTDGTAAGTTLVKDIYPGSPGSAPQELTAAGNLLFFLAYDPDFGVQPFRSDGTAVGTFRLTKSAGGAFQFGASPPSYGVHGLSAVNGKLLFFEDSVNGVALWKTDGTSAGAIFGTSGYQTSIQMADGYAVLGNNLFFHSGISDGQEIWRSDGTAPGTARVHNRSMLTSSFFLDGGRAYSRDGFAEFNGEVWFPSYDGTATGQLWKSDGTAAGTLKMDTHLDPEQLRVVDGHLVFANGGVWGTDGTLDSAAGLSPSNSFTLKLTRAGGFVYFAAGDASTGAELWKTDGTPAGSGLVADLVPGTAPSRPSLLTAVGDKVFFQASNEALYGAELWVSDGTEAGSFMAADLQPGPPSSNPQNLTAAEGLLFFTARTDSFGRELWKSDGTEAGTVLVKDIVAGAVSSNPGDPVEGTFAASPGGPLFFVADDLLHGQELWTSDGSEAGTVLVKDISAVAPGSQPRRLTMAGSRVFFVADDGAHGRELWVSDGTAAGTHLVKDIAPGAESSNPDNLTAVGSVLLFSATDGGHGVEAWRTDGTALGTRLVQDSAPGNAPASPLGFTPAGPNVYFAANDNTAGFELWALPQSNLQALFGDVPTTYFASKFVEALAAAGVTSGCGEGEFCPSSPVTRAEAAVFLLASRGGAVPPATGTRFQDVPPGYWAGPWIEELANEGIAGGCSASPPLFCPGSNLTRAEMAVMLLATRGVTPPPATGTVFSDVPASSWAAPWIEELAREGITSGCAVGTYCPGQPITRGEMAVFLVVNFGLPLP
ncbi:MAG: ELWxxDGT repeat protein [Thermoanaerobaculia bacterium]